MNKTTEAAILAAFCCSLVTESAFAADDGVALEVHGQATYVRQFKPAFDAAYSGPRSLGTEREYAYSFTGTLFLAARVGDSLELYFNPEAIQAVALSDLQGLGGFTNGENQRSSGPQLKAYRARLFGRYTWNLGGELEERESDANQVRTRYAAERVVLTAGNVSVLDVFDAVDISRDPRMQFMNWASLTYGAWDYAADARGYTWGAALEYITPSWSVRGGRFLMPVESNGLKLDRDFTQHYGDVVELERALRFGERRGSFRLLAFRNRMVSGSFRDALDLAAQTGSTPDVAAVRREQSKHGFGAGLQLELTRDLGAYVRAGWNDGRTETFAFTEIDRSLAAGLLLKGTEWKRPEDSIGFAGYLNGISQAHRDYLAAGGQGFFLGDGQLNYGQEKILELFYSLSIVKGTWLTADFQHIANPGYNRDRGPAQVYNLRAHFEF
jgi:hypothetical protein